LAKHIEEKISKISNYYSSAKKPGDLHFWSGLMRIKDSFLSLGHFKLNDERNLWFWEDRWLGNFTLQHQYSSLYAITSRKNASVAMVFSMIPLNISFRRGLAGHNLSLWHIMVARVAHIRLNGVHDKFIWGLHPNGMFSMNSMYKALIMDTRVRTHLGLWRMKIPLGIKIFLWYLK
jgi:hypothetical protein